LVSCFFFFSCIFTQKFLKEQLLEKITRHIAQILLVF